MTGPNAFLPANESTASVEPTTSLNMGAMLPMMLDCFPELATTTLADRAKELQDARPPPPGRFIPPNDDVWENTYGYEAGERIVDNPVPANMVSKPHSYRRVAPAATGVCQSLVRAPRYVRDSTVPLYSSRSRSKPALAKEKDAGKDGAKDGRKSVSKHPYERVDKTAARPSKGGKGPKHLQGVPAELLAHDHTAASPTLRSSSPASSASSSSSSPKRKSSGKKASPTPKKSKSKSPSPDTVAAAAKKATKKAKTEAIRKRVTFAFDLAHAARICVPPELPGPVLRSQAADGIAASLAALSIATRV